MNTGDRLPELRVAMTAQKIISAAAATRDWQPIHHDHEAAIKAGLRGVILNSPSQAGWISKYITDWAGLGAIIKRMSFRMKDSICPGDEMALTGEVSAVDGKLVTVAVTISVGEKQKTTAEVRFELP
jgi:acyl dehydratase